MAKRRKTKLASDVAAFVRQYARKRKPGVDPNDRAYDRGVEALIRRMKPEELDALLRDAAEEDDESR